MDGVVAGVLRYLKRSRFTCTAVRAYIKREMQLSTSKALKAADLRIECETRMPS